MIRTKYVYNVVILVTKYEKVCRETHRVTTIVECCRRSGRRCDPSIRFNPAPAADASCELAPPPTAPPPAASTPAEETSGIAAATSAVCIYRVRKRERESERARERERAREPAATEEAMGHRRAFAFQRGRPVRTLDITSIVMVLGSAPPHIDHRDRMSTAPRD